jgi:hypothetical protein
MPGSEVKTMDLKHLSLSELEAGLDHIRQSPKEAGILKMIVRRPNEDEREVVVSAELDLATGLIGVNWRMRGSRHTSDGASNPDAQITIMNSRAIELLAQSEERWSLAGDQLFIEMDLSADNLPPGTRLALGSAVLEVSVAPHTGCKKFAARYGTDATKFVNSPQGKRLHLRGINSKVIQAGRVRIGDVARKL